MTVKKSFKLKVLKKVLKVKKYLKVKKKVYKLIRREEKLMSCTKYYHI